MPDQPDTSPPERAPTPGSERAGNVAGGSRDEPPKRRHRVLVWTLIVLASVLLDALNASPMRTPALSALLAS